MIITCEQCSTRFNLDDSLIQPQGSKVRCSKCKHIFTAFPEVQESEEIEFEEPMDIAIAAPDDIKEEPATGDIEIDTPDTEVTPEINFSEDSDLSLGDGDIEFEDIEFDAPQDLDDIPDFDEIDIDGPAGEDTLSDLEMEMDEDFETLDTFDDIETLDDIEEEKLDPASSDTGPMFEDDLTLDALDMDIEDIEDIEPLPVQSPSLTQDTGGDSGDIEFNFDEDAGEVDLEMDLELEDLSPDAEPARLSTNDLEDIEFESEDLDDGLELIFEDAPDADLVFEDPVKDLDALEASLEIDDEFEQVPDILDGEEFEPGLELEEEPDFFIEEDLSDHEINERGSLAEDKKFTEYDSVLEQEDESEEVEIPDSELDEVPEDIQEETKIEVPAPPEKESEEEGFIGGAPLSGVKEEKRKKKSAIGTLIKILALLFLLVIAAYIAALKLGAEIPYLSGINIPYVTDALKPPPKAVTYLKPVPNEASLKGRFISNATAGELFVVTGQVSNPAKIAYSNIVVKGTLVDKNKAKVSTLKAYCGNIIPEDTLKKGNISDIAKQLNVKQGLQNANVNIKPGDSVPFMLVFSNLPDNLTNFTVEVIQFNPQNKKS